jgi:DNA-binding CsgD family transcriptional regulator
MSERVCKGCGTALPPKTWQGRDRVWCSERCRKRQYDLTCVECGGRVDGTTPSKIPNLDEPVCASCAAGHYAIWTPEAIVCAIQEWADEHGGIPPSANDWWRARARGYSGACNPNHVIARFGSWNAGIRAAGFTPHAGGPLGGGYTPLTSQQRAECARRYAAGESSTSIAADFGCSPLTVVNWVRKAGVEIRPGFAKRAAA